MLVWRTLKRYEKTGDIQNRPGQGHPRTARTPKPVKSPKEKIRRNPKRFIQNLAKESNVSYGIMSTVLRKDLKMSPFKHAKKHRLSAQVVDRRLQRCKILLSRIQDGTLPNLVFSDEKKFDVEHHFNTQNVRVWSRNGDEGSVWWLGSMSGLSDGLGNHNRVRKKSTLFLWSRGKIQPADLSRWHPC